MTRLFFIISVSIMLGTLAHTAKAKPNFPSVVNKFHSLEANKIRQKKFGRQLIGKTLNGVGYMRELSECSFMSNSKKYGRSCYEVTLEANRDGSGNRVILYYSTSDESELENFNKGQRISFKCRVTKIKHWGFWSTAYCDM